MSNHVLYAVVSGTLVAAAWGVLDPLSLGTLRAVAAGYVLGAVVYTGVALLDASTTNA